MRIEEGCLALVVDGLVHKNIGKSVRVGKFLGEVKDWIGDDNWEVSEKIIGTYGTPCYHSREKYLMRIDGLKEEEISHAAQSN